MPTKLTDVELPEPSTKKTEFAGFRLDKETRRMLDDLAKDTGGNRSAVLVNLVKKASRLRLPQQERESML